ncbi:MAG: hypothetical protein RLZZ76_301 [Candidatus Parcubacteria bacterium]
MGHEKLIVLDGQAVGLSVGSSLTGNPTHDAWFAEIKTVYQALVDQNKRPSIAAIAKRCTLLSEPSVKKMYALYPGLFRKMPLRSIHVAGK